MTYLGEGYDWNWVTMQAISKWPLNRGDVHELRWNEQHNNLESRRSAMDGWLPVIGHFDAIKSYKNYVADKIILEDE